MPRPEQLTGTLQSYYQTVRGIHRFSDSELAYLTSLESDDLLGIYSFFSYMEQNPKAPNAPEETPEQFEEKIAAFNDRIATDAMFGNTEKRNYRALDPKAKKAYQKDNRETIVGRQFESTMMELVNRDSEQNGLGRFYATESLPHEHFLKTDNTQYESSSDLLNDLINGRQVFAYRVGELMPCPVKMAYGQGRVSLALGDPIKKPKEVKAPGLLTKFLAFFGHKASVKKKAEFETYQKNLADYTRFENKQTERSQNIEGVEKPYIPKEPAKQKMYSEMSLREKSEIFYSRNNWENVSADELYFRLAKDYLSSDKKVYGDPYDGNSPSTFAHKLQDITMDELDRLGRVDKVIGTASDFYETMQLVLQKNGQNVQGADIKNGMLDLGKRIFCNALCSGRTDIVESIVKKYVLDDTTPREYFRLKQYLENGSLTDKEKGERELKDKDCAKGNIGDLPSMNEMCMNASNWFMKKEILDPVTAYVGMAAYDRIMMGGDYDKDGFFYRSDPSSKEKAFMNTCRIIKNYNDFHVRMFNAEQNAKNSPLKDPNADLSEYKYTVDVNDLKTIGSYQLLSGAFANKAKNAMPFVYKFNEETALVRSFIGKSSSYDAETVIEEAVKVATGVKELEKNNQINRDVTLPELISETTDVGRIDHSFKSIQNTIGMKMMMIAAGSEKRELTEDEVKSIQVFTNLTPGEIGKLNKTRIDPKPEETQNVQQKDPAAEAQRNADKDVQVVGAP